MLDNVNMFRSCVPMQDPESGVTLIIFTALEYQEYVLTAAWKNHQMFVNAPLSQDSLH